MGNVFIMKEKKFQNIEKKERVQMKKKLFRWGRTLDFCQRKQREIDKLQKMAKQFFVLGKNAPFLGEEVVTLEEAKQIYEREIIKIVEYIEKEMEEYSKMGRYIEQLEYEEQIFLKLRYEKEYQYNYISLQLHKSRAKCFRDHDVILDKLIVICKEQKLAA